MNRFLGIDLGSTTTKAILLDEQGHIAGRGLTNTRANFETASTLARAAALADGRFNYFGARLRGSGVRESRREALMAKLRQDHERAIRKSRLVRLRRRCADLTAAKPELRSPLEELFDGLDARPGDDAGDASLADILRAEVTQDAEPLATKSGVSYEALVGVFERALVADEVDDSVIDPEETLAALREKLEDPAENRALDEAVSTRIELLGQAGTGYGRHRLPFAKEEIRSEILCHGLGAYHVYPDTRTILDIGGQDTKAIQLDEDGLVTSFQMNDRCAAGCGRYLGYVADELGLQIGELGPLAMGSSCPSQINSTCTVFAGTEIRERLAIGEAREDVVAGLHRAIVVRAMSLLARSGGVRNALTFSGGVGRNLAVVQFLKELITQHYGAITINVSADSIFNGALGAALFARMDAEVLAC